MTDTELIARQAKILEEQKLIIADYKKAFKDIRSILYSIGAPLNDNVNAYTNKQLGPFQRIADIVENL